MTGVRLEVEKLKIGYLISLFWHRKFLPKILTSSLLSHASVLGFKVAQGKAIRSVLKILPGLSASHNLSSESAVLCEDIGKQSQWWSLHVRGKIHQKASVTTHLPENTNGKVQPAAVSGSSSSIQAL